MADRAPQLPLDLVPQFGWGGARRGAGRKPRGEQPGISHARRLEPDRHRPVHVTLRAKDHVWNLRSRRCYAIFAAALRGVLDRPDFRVVHFSVQGNHVHLIVEAGDAGALARGMRAVTGRIAMRLNALMGMHGRVFVDRYHAHVLRTPAEARHALAYVLGNFVSHALRRGERVPAGFVDPYCSAADRGPDGERPPVSEPHSWLLRTGGVVVREPVAEYRVAFRGQASAIQPRRARGPPRPSGSLETSWRRVLSALAAERGSPRPRGAVARGHHLKGAPIQVTTSE